MTPTTDSPQLEALVRETRQQLLEGMERLLLSTASRVLHEETDLLIVRTREMLAQVVDDLVQRHAAPLVAQLRLALRQTLEEVVRGQMEPLLERARQSMQDSAQFAAVFADAVVARLKVTLAGPAGDFLRDELPRYAHWAGRRSLDYALAAILFCLAAVFLLIGTVLGLQAAGVEPFATYLVSGMVALGGGLVFLRLSSRKSN
jgi:hypothetical protein